MNSAFVSGGPKVSVDLVAPEKQSTCFVHTVHKPCIYFNLN